MTNAKSDPFDPSLPYIQNRLDLGKYINVIYIYIYMYNCIYVYGEREIGFFF